MTPRYRGPCEVPGSRASTANEKVILFHVPPLVGVTTTPLGRVNRVATSVAPGGLETVVDCGDFDDTGGVAALVVVPQPLITRTLATRPADQPVTDDVFMAIPSFFRNDHRGATPSAIIPMNDTHAVEVL